MKIALVVSFAAAFLPFAAHAAQTIDCKSALSKSEYAVCNSPSLLKLDSHLNADLEILKQDRGGATTSSPEQIKNWLHAFAEKRDTCGPNEACLKDLYTKQLAPLDNAVERKRLQQGGPGIH
jgi:uncharacterized protein